MTKEPQSLQNLSLCLSNLKCGESGTLVAIDDHYEQKDFLKELGFTESCKIEVLRKAPLGDPIHIRVRETNFALRKADAKCLHVIKTK